MARRRMLEVTIAHDKDFNTLSEFAQLLYLRTLPHTDDYGRFEGDVDVLKVRVDPFGKRDISEYEEAIREIAAVHLWSVYRLPSGKTVIQFDAESFERINKFLIKSRSLYEYPPYSPAYELICGDMPAYHIERVKKKEKREKKKEERNEDFESLWAQYPNRSGKSHALRHFLATVKTSEDLDRIRTALKNYLGSGNVKNGYIKNGSTWFNEWQDWIDPTDAMMKGNSNARKGGYKFDASKYPTLRKPDSRPV